MTVEAKPAQAKWLMAAVSMALFCVLAAALLAAGLFVLAVAARAPGSTQE